MEAGGEMAKKKSRARLQSEDKTYLIHAVGNNVTKILRDLIMWSALVLIFRYSYLAISDLSGKFTSADINVNAQGALAVGSKSLLSALAEVSTFCFLALIFGLGGIIYGRRQAKLKRDIVEQYHPYKVAEETKVDPGRTSSKLLPRGDTRPEDK